MKTLRQENSFASQKIEIEQDKIFVFVKIFWIFSKYYGGYIASLHSKRKYKK
ncbi:hypothetical protein H1P_150006 [Hyella patelloides LEGE 07179]|uniref:Uncharacterized protein n=1 Tax=Hyella patelloides LEGE 07179 TaxID=945734 RepID=A0A563VM05_9CYAN|nr:hypothetical protein [Hyella patelloides]VEP12442.1 hypothetical protein H1P_150006 [Hyella patelloides LEGE 07179]